ncbi:hypothetical protein R3W88_004130 [Solanum pinnatisectum]|uniref:Uncharacterized protein n=1 Tax=Solanum pinnatisectum TaxID=50273 RepID=A0AAV9MRI3_9SOLN|nr:hypothetical protein R3W88_004130 [Solanum pinnatisectum]
MNRKGPLITVISLIGWPDSFALDVLSSFNQIMSKCIRRLFCEILLLDELIAFTLLACMTTKQHLRHHAMPLFPADVTICPRRHNMELFHYLAVQAAK